MTVIARTPARFEIRRGLQALKGASGAWRCSLRATDEGWSLLAPGGRIIFRGLGSGSRRECLEFARVHGVLAVTG